MEGATDSSTLNGQANKFTGRACLVKAYIIIKDPKS